MALLDSIKASLFKLAEDLLGRLLGPIFGQLVDKVLTFIDHVKNIFGTIQELIDTVKGEVDEWVHFRENIKIKSRVINIPKAYDATKDLIVGFKDAWKSAVDIVKEFKSKLTSETAVEDAKSAAADIEEGGAGTLLKRLPALARGLEKLLGVLTLIVDALESIVNVLEDLRTLVNEAKAIREEIESLESLFLSQGNARRSVKIVGGGSMRIRVGNLHS